MTFTWVSSKQDIPSFNIDDGHYSSARDTLKIGYTNTCKMLRSKVKNSRCSNAWLNLNTVLFATLIVGDIQEYPI